ncbi:mucin-3B-like [Pseudophryne corroboree]|uniref:mucin-3B-like n=1 Tax=Pseudophryne corroboree TaxID=495146 RepID=UPI003081DF6B
MGATMVWKFGIIVIISLVGKLSAVQKCLNVFTDKHLEYLDEMIAGQLESACTIRKDLIIKGHLTDYCYNKIRLHQLWNLLGSLTFKNGSLSHKHTELLKDLYKNEMTGCINSDDIKEEHIMACSETTDLSPTGILETVRGSFLIYQKFQPDFESDEECEVLYNKCSKVDDYPTTKGIECSCPSSTTLITQKSLHGLSEHKSATYTASPPSHTTPLVKGMSSTYPHKPTSPQRSTQGAGTSSVISTNMPTELQALTATMDHSHAATTLHVGANTVSSHNNMDLTLISTEFPKGTTEILDMTLNPSRSSSNPQQVSKEPSNSNKEWLYAESVPPTTGGPSTNAYSIINEEFSNITKPIVGEMLNTKQSDFVSQHSKVPIFGKYLSKPSKEPGIESSSSSVTKIRRSLIDVDEISKAFVRTPTLSTGDSGTYIPFLSLLHASFPSTGNGLSTSESSVLQEKGTVERNLGWASNYFSASTLTTKSSRTGLLMSSPSLRVTQLLSEVSRQHTPLTAHKGGYTHNILPLQEVELADFMSDNRENRFVGPNHGSNLLHLIATEKHGDDKTEEHRKSNLFIIFIIILSILGLLWLCGLLYYRYHYRLLQRRLHRDCDLQFPEESPLQLQITEIV